MTDITPYGQDPVVLTFNDTELTIIDKDGQRWVTATQLAQALGYADYRDLHKLIKRNDDEFVNKIGVGISPTEGYQPVKIINYHGVIRVAMLSKTPRAKDFRDWAETVLFEVMTKGYHIQPKAEAAVIELMGEVVVQSLTHALTPIMQRLEAVEARQDQVFIPAPQDNSFWPTPSERVRVLVDPREIPKGFNSGASFDVFAAQRSADVGKGFLSQRNRRHLNKLPDYVIQPCRENDEFLRETFRIWMRTRHQQLALKLSPARHSNQRQGTPNYPETT